MGRPVGIRTAAQGSRCTWAVRRQRRRIDRIPSRALMARKPLRSQLNQIRAWVRQGRTDAWIAHQLDVSAAELREFRRRHELTAEDDSGDIDLRDEIEAEIEAELAEQEAEAREEEEDEGEDEEREEGSEEGERRRKRRRRRRRRTDAP